jgi:flotillin
MYGAKAEDARAERERSTQNANVVIPAQIAKQKQLLMHKQKLKNKRISKGKLMPSFKMEKQKVYMKS